MRGSHVPSPSDCSVVARVPHHLCLSRQHDGVGSLLAWHHRVEGDGWEDTLGRVSTWSVGIFFLSFPAHTTVITGEIHASVHKRRWGEGTITIYGHAKVLNCRLPVIRAKAGFEDFTLAAWLSELLRAMNGRQKGRRGGSKSDEFCMSTLVWLFEHSYNFFLDWTVLTV